MKESRKGKESQEAKRKERSRQREGRETWNNGVCVPFVGVRFGNHIDLPP